MHKRFLCLFLAILMLVSVMPVSANATVPQKRTGTFWYSSIEMQDYEAPYFYDDAYFYPSAYTYQDSLATMSMCLSMAAHNSYRTEEGDYAGKSRNLEDLLVQCGFPADHFAINPGYQNRPTTDSVGVGASYKTITVDGEDCTLVAVAVRGGNYESEWANNFTLGLSGDHQGFAEARDQALAFLKDYVSDQNLSGRVKLWITGYSRGAVTANMAAAALDAGYVLSEDISLVPEDIYAYCPGCPQGTVDADRNDPIYHNIFNIVSPADFIAKMAPTQPAQFGFGRYGVDLYLPTAQTSGDDYYSLREAMIRQLNQIPSAKPYQVDNFQMKKLDIRSVFNGNLIVDNNDPRWNQITFLEEFLYVFFNDLIRDRSNYVYNYQDDFRTLCCIAFRDEDKTELFAEKFIENLTNQILPIAVCLVLNREDQLADIVRDVVLASMRDAGMTGYTDQEIDDMTRVMVKLLLSFGRENPELTITLIYNLEGIISIHYPEQCFAWLRALDPNYTPEGAAAFASGIGGIHRVSGNNRYETAFLAAENLRHLQMGEKFQAIVIASGSQFPDALAGSYLANQKNAPILLVNRHTTEDVADYVSQNLAFGGTVYLLGGESAVSNDLEAALGEFHVKRLSGANRYETNLEILKEADNLGDMILVCTGRSFADSLSASAVNKPILLVNRALSDNQKAFLEDFSGTFLIIGGESAISPALAEELSAYGTVERIGGNNRYETSVLVAERFFTQPKSLVLAYAKNFPDGLSGGPLAFRTDAPLILTATGKETEAARYAADHGISNGIIMGGTGLISDDSISLILNP